MKTEREMIRAAEAEGYRKQDGNWFRKEYCSPEEQEDLAAMEAQNAVLPEDVRYDSGEMRWYRLIPAPLDEDAMKDILTHRMARDIRHVKKLCIAILAALAVLIVAAVLYVIFNAREPLG